MRRYSSSEERDYQGHRGRRDRRFAFDWSEQVPDGTYLAKIADVEDVSPCDRDEDTVWEFRFEVLTRPDGGALCRWRHDWEDERFRFKLDNLMGVLYPDGYEGDLAPDMLKGWWLRAEFRTNFGRTGRRFLNFWEARPLEAGDREKTANWPQRYAAAEPEGDPAEDLPF